MTINKLESVLLAHTKSVGLGGLEQGGRHVMQRRGDGFGGRRSMDRRRERGGWAGKM